MERRGEPPGAQPQDVRAAAPSPADAGPWRRGLVVTRPATDQADSSQPHAAGTKLSESLKE